MALWLGQGIFHQLGSNSGLRNGSQFVASKLSCHPGVLRAIREAILPVVSEKGKFSDFHENSQPSFLRGITHVLGGLKPLFFICFMVWGVQGLLVFRH